MNKFFNFAFKLLFVSFFACAFMFSCAKKEDIEVENSSVENTEGIENTENVKNKEEATEGEEEAKKELDLEKLMTQQEELPPPTAKEIGYAYGVILAKAVKMNHLEINAGAVYKGLLDNIDLSNEDINMADQEAENKEKADAFLAENKGKEGVITLDSGVQYEILEKGDEEGKKPVKESTVKVVYEGKFLDGKVFDSSAEEGTELSLERVIEGWKELIPLMNVGMKVKTYIPASQGYGERGIKYEGQEIIPPNALLIFEIKLIDVVEPEAKNEQTSEK